MEEVDPCVKAYNEGYDAGYNFAKREAADLVLQDLTTSYNGKSKPYIDSYNTAVLALANRILEL